MMTARHGASPSSAGQRPATGGFVIGHGEEAFLGAGWHERELRQPGRTPYRGVEREASFQLTEVHGGACLTLLLTAPVSVFGEAYRAELLQDGRGIGHIVLENDNWAVRRFRLLAPLAGIDSHFELRSDMAFVPAKTLEGNRDFREISCYLAAALVTAGGPDPLAADSSPPA